MDAPRQPDRCSTRQGRSGLGLDAQRQAVANYLNGGDWQMVSEHTEVEIGKRADRPELEKAMAVCRVYRATLVIAKIDRLSRDAHFLLGLQKAGVDFIAVDMPDANKLTVGIMAILAQHEREMISRRTKEALAMSKARHEREGRPWTRPDNLDDEARARGRENAAKALARIADDRAADVIGTIEEIQAEGVTSLSGIAKALNAKGVPTARGGKWQFVSVQRVLKRAPAETADASAK